jgi:flagellar protein FlaG
MEITGQINSTAQHSGLSAMKSSVGVVNRTLKYKVYDKNKIAVAVLDKKSGKIIREIPPEDLQKLSVKMDEMIGKLFDQIV